MRNLGPWPWALLAVGTVGAFATGSQPWWQVPYPDGVVPIPGNEAAAGLPATLAGVLAAGLLLAWAVRGRGRIVLGAVLSAVALGVVVLGLVAPHPPADVVDRLVQAVTLDRPAAPNRAWGGYGYAACGIAALLGAVGLAVGARRGIRDEPSVDRFQRVAQTQPVAADDDPLSVWRALDDGRDPTASEPATDHASTPMSPDSDDGARMDPSVRRRHGRQT